MARTVRMMDSSTERMTSRATTKARGVLRVEAGPGTCLLNGRGRFVKFCCAGKNLEILMFRRYSGNGNVSGIFLKFYCLAEILGMQFLGGICIFIF